MNDIIVGVVTLLGLGGLGYGIYLLSKAIKNGLTMDKLLLEHKADFLKIFATACTVAETMRLILDAASIAGTNILSAVFTYAIPALCETFLAFSFYTQIKKGLENSIKPDSKGGSTITPWETIKTIVGAIPMFLASFAFTIAILYFYLENMNVFEVKYTTSSWIPLYVETNVENFSESMGETKRINLPNIFLILLTPALNVVIAFVMRKEVMLKVKASQKDNKDKKDEEKEKKKEEDKNNVSTTVLSALEKYFGVQNAKEFFLEYTGKKSGNLTHADVKSGSKTPEDILKELKFDLIDDTSTHSVNKFISCSNKMKSTLESIKIAIKDLNKDYDEFKNGNTALKLQVKGYVENIERLISDCTTTKTERDKLGNGITKYLNGIAATTNYNKELDVEYNKVRDDVKNLNLANIKSSL